MVRNSSVFGAILVLALTVAIAGCGKKDESKKGKQPEEPAKVPEEKPKQPTPPPGGDGTGAIIPVEAEFMTPESVLYDAEDDLYLVSNINGTPLEKDDNGFISKLSPEGKVVEMKWIDGATEEVTLNAPKGLAIAEGVLYVADIDTVRMFDLATGKPKGDVPVKGATFMNDVYGPVTLTGSGGKTTTVVYATDSGMNKEFKPTGTDAVYRISGGKAEPVLKDKDLGGPNGVFADDKAIWVVTFRKNELFSIVDGKKADVVELPKGGLDGIVRLPGGDFLISSWEAKAVFRGPPAGPFEAVIEGVESPADIGYDTKRNRVLIPLFQKNRVEIHSLD